MNLLKITTTPLKIAINVEKPKYEEAEPSIDPIKVSTPRANKRVTQINSKIIDRKQPEVAKQDVFQTTQTETIQTGYVPLKLSSVNGYRADLAMDNLIATHGGQEISSLKQERIMSEMPQIAYIPVTSSGEAKWEPNTLNLEFESMQLDLDVELMKKQFKYIPSRLTFEIEQYPSVEIEYIGDPLYVPPSANPNYENNQ